MVHLLHQTQSSEKRMFSRWNQTTRNVKQIESCRRTIGLFEIINNSIKQSLDSLLENDRSTKLKETAIRRLIHNSSLKQRKLFS